jgi:1-deoxy-D-xylulose-5-phosphate synthase
MTKILDTINSPQDVKKLKIDQLEKLAGEIRQEIIETVSRTGGHLASNLGNVELTLALHYVFDFKTDHLLWDVGHQCYAHKLITGRKELFKNLRQKDGASGFPSPQESEYDRFTVGHAGTSIPTGIGMGIAAKKLGKKDHIVTFVGDASIVNGLALEALNYLQDLKRQFLIVLNDNSMAIDVTQGAIATMLSRVRLSHTYEEINKTTKNILEHIPLIGKKMDNAIANFKKTIKMSLPASRLFESLNITYFGPVDGHDIRSLIQLFNGIKDIDYPVVLHTYTNKGKGFHPAGDDPRSFHSTGPFTNDNGKITHIKPENRKTFTSVIGDTITELAREDARVTAVTAAMPDGTGLRSFKTSFPDRCFDVGIAEGAAVDIAAGQAKMGLRPFVCIYSTFLQRGFDQIAHEVSLQNLPVIFCIDRAGVVGDDGPTHHGMLDMAFLRSLPNMTVLAPATAREAQNACRYALGLDSPCAIRYPRDYVPQNEGLETCDADFVSGKSVTIIDNDSKIVIVSYGSCLRNAYEAAAELKKRGIEVKLINARFAKPLDCDIIELYRAGKTIVTVEEHSLTCGFGSALLEACFAGRRADESGKSGNAGRISIIGGPDRFIDKNTRNNQLHELGVDSESIINTVIKLNNMS